jgi:glycosyltransferase involved in cell wall biosynthesis
MKVLHLITELELGGAERLLATVLPKFDQAKLEVSVAYLYGDAPLRSGLEQAGIRVTKLDSRSKFDWATFSRLVKLLRHERIDILHTHLIQADLLGYFAGRRARVPRIVSTKHNTHYFRAHHGWLARFDPLVNRRLSCIVAVSEAVKQFYIQTEGLDPSLIEVIYNGIDLEEFQKAKPLGKSELGLKETDLVVCAIGSLTEKKNHSFLLQIWPDIAQRIPRAHLVLVGDGPLRPILEKLGDDPRTTGKVHFLGRRSDVPSLLRTADLFVLPSLWEGFGIAVLEAMAAGIPVIASNVDGIREIVRTGQDGLLLDPRSAQAWQDAIQTLLTDPVQARTLATSARSRAQQFSLRDTVSKLESLYERLMFSLPSRKIR